MRAVNWLWLTGVLWACGGNESALVASVAPASPAALEDHCAEVIGPPRVEEVASGVFMARGFDLANTIVITTEAGNVVVDAGMSPGRSQATKAALQKVAPGPTLALIYTHSHIDHVGGASVWVEPDTQVWATDLFTDHFFKQYAEFLPAESNRGARQFGRGVPAALLPCSALGRQADLDLALRNGAVVPTHTFSGTEVLTLGGREIRLVEAHGETHDQLFVHVPDVEALLPGDNWYVAFPNLYTIRGTAPRPVDAWVASLDAMRGVDPKVLIPSHTAPVIGRDKVRAELVAYRDGIQWVRDAVVRGANAGIPVDELAATVKLPAHLDERSLLELYGQVDWSVRAIYGSELGWFDGQASALYPLPPEDLARREVEMMGGVDAVRASADSALAQGELRWACTLFGKLDRSGLSIEGIDASLADCWERLAGTVPNSNGRGYLLTAAAERRGVAQPLGEPVVAEAFLQGMPIEQLFQVMGSRLLVDQAIDVHESVRIEFSDLPNAYTVTIRRGVVEVVEGAPLPGTPEPVAVVQTDSMTWKRMALQVEAPAAAVLAGRLKADPLLAFKGFMDRFDRRLLRPPERKP